MPKFEYIAKSVRGVETTSHITADSQEAAVELLHRDGLIVLSIRPASMGFASRLQGDTPLFARGVAAGVIALFTRQLSAMIKAGLPLIRALHALARDEHDRRLSKTLVRVASDIEAGETFSSALRRHPAVFPKLYVSLVKAGEESGRLADILRQLSVYLERAESIKRKVRTATAYPIFVICFVIIASAALFLKVVPMMADIYKKLGAELPALTQAVINASDFIRAYVWLLPVLLIVLFLVRAMLKRSTAGRLLLDSWKLRVFIFGPILRKVVIAKFLRTLGVLVDSGIPMLEALELASETAGSEVIAQASLHIRDTVARGGHLSKGFSEADVFPEIVVQMVATGEETGTLGEMLDSMAGFYDEQVETSISGLSSFIEPLLIIMIGAVVAIVVISTFLPIFYLSQAVRRGMR